jgi:putative phosphoesterase
MVFGPVCAILPPMIGLLYDVHGNLPALEAVLEDAQATGVRRWVVGGDVALFGPFPAETVARLRALQNAAWLCGNTDRWITDPPGDEVMESAAASCRPALGDDIAQELGALPFSIRDGATLYVHAGPTDDMTSFQPEPADDEPELLAAVPEDVRTLVFGHTHLAFARRAGDVLLVNPGSVGMPLDGDQRAAWAVQHDDGRIEHRRVVYDHEGAAAALEERFGDAPWVELIAGRLRRARA